MSASAFRTVWKDWFRLAKVCGLLNALRWLLMIGVNLDQCYRAQSLSPADKAMGQGPFRVRLRGVEAKLTGPEVFGGIREIWARDVYLGNGYLTIPPDGVVLDLGANIGNFTNLALAHGSGVRVISVEPNRVLGDLLHGSVALNHRLKNVSIVRAFVGGATSLQWGLMARAEFNDSSYISEERLLADYNINSIDFLKCDIEGSEFGLLTSESKLLKITKQIAIEIHDFAGNRGQMIETLNKSGFHVGVIRHDPQGCIALAKKT